MHRIESGNIEIQNSTNLEVAQTAIVFKTDFRLIKDSLHRLASFYCQNKLPYLSSTTQCDKLDLQNPYSKEIINYKNVTFDCFSFFWYILQNLQAEGLLPNTVSLNRFVNNTIKIIEIAIANIYIVELKNEAQLVSNQCGVFFFLETKSGMTNRTERHIGFYFIFEDQYFIIDNSFSKSGVSRTNYRTLGELFNYLHGKYKCYIKF